MGGNREFGMAMARFELTIDVLEVHTKAQLIMVLIPFDNAKFLKFETKLLVADAYNQTFVT